MNVQYGRVATRGRTGVYADGRIRCQCAECEAAPEFSYFSPNAWEKHLGFKTRNKWRKYIHLTSGTPLYDALNQGGFHGLDWTGMESKKALKTS